MSVTLVSDAIFEEVRDYLWAQLETPLSLKTCEQGNYLSLPPGDDLDAILPLVLVEWDEGIGTALKGFDGMRLDHAVLIHWVGFISDSAMSTRAVSAALLTIANLFSSPPWDGKTGLPGYTPATAINIFDRTAPTMRVLDTFSELEIPLGHGVVEFRVSIDYFD